MEREAEDEGRADTPGSSCADGVPPRQEGLTLMDLPDEEVLLRVFSFLPERRQQDLVAVRLVCRLWHRLADDKSLALPRKRQIVVQVVGSVDAGKTTLVLALKEIEATLLANKTDSPSATTATTTTTSAAAADSSRDAMIAYAQQFGYLNEWQDRYELHERRLYEMRAEWPTTHWQALYGDGVAVDCIETPDAVFCLLQNARMSARLTCGPPVCDITLWVASAIIPLEAQLIDSVRDAVQGEAPLVVAVNVMDHPTVCWADTLYNRVVAESSNRTKRTTHLSFVPISAKARINLHESIPKDVCSWYQGPTLLQALQASEQLPARRPTTEPLLARVMRSNGGDLASAGDGDRPLAGFHNLHVRVLSGSMSAGDRLLALPNKVGQLRTFQCGAIINVRTAQPGEHVGLALRCGIEDDARGHADEQAMLDSAELLIDPTRLDRYVCATTVVASFSVAQLPDNCPIITPGLNCQLVGWTSTYDCTIERLVGEYDAVTKKRKQPSPRFVRSRSLVKFVLKLDRPVCFSRDAYPPSTRFTLRVEGQAIGRGSLMSPEPATGITTGSSP